MTDDRKPVLGNTTHADRVGNVVQSEKLGAVHINHHDRRGIVALTVVAVLLIAAGVYFWSTRAVEKPAGERVAAVVDVAPKSDCESGWVVPDRGDTPIPMGTPPVGAVLGTGGRVTVTVQGLTGDSVVLHGIEVDVVARRPAMTGVFLPSSCGSDLEPRFLRVDLTAARPVAKPVDGGEFPYKVSGSDPEQFVITPVVTDAAVDWRLRIHWSSGGEKGELVVDDAGKPLRTTATTNTRPFCVEQPDAQQWIPRTEGAPC
ncbi:MAG: hypothetical protein M3422_06790 [Actinomycetota bacterium]|nr:hypothetical protein [Actinomycetota bacterium]